MDIFQLYHKEKMVTHETPEGQKVSVVITKPTRGDKEKIFKEMNKVRAEAEKEARENDTLAKNMEDLTKSYSRAEQTDVILNNEEAQQMQSSDLFPVGDRDSMTEEAIAVAEAEFLTKWREKRAIQLAELTDDEIAKKTKDIFIESHSLVAAGEMYNKQIMLYCIYDDKHKRVFRTIEDVDRLDEVIFNWLRTEIDKFTQMLTQKDIRKAVKDTAFLSSTESEKSTTDSVTTIN